MSVEILQKKQSSDPFIKKSIETPLPGHIYTQLMQSFLSSFYKIVQHNKRDSLEALVYKASKILFNKNKLFMHFIDKNDVKFADLKSCLGYFSSYDNCIYIICDKTHFNSKFLGLMTDYNSFKSEYILSYIKTVSHELIHYASFNAYNSYLSIWEPIYRQYMWDLFHNLLGQTYYELFKYDDDKSATFQLSALEFVNNNEFKKAFDIYFNLVKMQGAMRFRSFYSIQSRISDELYANCQFEYARFFDNVICNIIRLMEGIYIQPTMAIYYSLYNAYHRLDSTISKERYLRNIMFYQEIFEFSEIACVLMGAYNDLSNNEIKTACQKTIALLI